MSLGARQLHSVKRQCLIGVLVQTPYNFGCFDLASDMTPLSQASAAAACRPSASSSIIFLLNAGISSGLRLETSPLSTTTSSSNQLAPASGMLNFTGGYKLIVRAMRSR